MTTIGSLFTGYGGLDMGVAMAVDPDATDGGTLMRVPIRVQRQRTRGWRMPAHTKYVGRGSLYGNPYRVARTRRELDAADPMIVATPEEAVERFREWIATTREGRHVADSARRILWGLDLACWCPPGQPCHADVLLEIANPRGLAEYSNPYYRMWDRPAPTQESLLTDEETA